MIQEALAISLQIVALHVACWHGNLLAGVKSRIGNFLAKRCGRREAILIQKPLYDCLPCMASVWTCLLSWSFDVKLILVVAGLNVIVERIIGNEDERLPTE